MMPNLYVMVKNGDMSIRDAIDYNSVVSSTEDLVINKSKDNVKCISCNNLVYFDGNISNDIRIIHDDCFKIITEL